MSIIRLEANHFRNLHPLQISFNTGFNIICGANGAGKTSVLEAIYYLLLGKSFRSTQIARIINHSEAHFTLFGILALPISQHRIGIEKNKSAETKIQIDGEIIRTIADLAVLQPVQIINPQTVQLVDTGPQTRRQFLDWGLFHVEQSFHSLWKRLQRVLKQRNAALRKSIPQQEIRLWDEELIDVSRLITGMRESYFSNLLPLFKNILRDLIEIPALELQYYIGWDNKRSLSEVLEQAITRDCIVGYTQYGPQRADIMIKQNNVPANEVLSRGQQKLLSLALRLAQGVLLRQTTQRQCVYLIDDLASELDQIRLNKVLHFLNEESSQIIMTSLGNKHKKDIPIKCFHIDQGLIKEI